MTYVGDHGAEEVPFDCAFEMILEQVDGCFDEGRSVHQPFARDDSATLTFVQFACVQE